MVKQGNPKQLIIRADANPKIGTGHIMRCLALAQAWQTYGGEVTFVSACQSESLCQRLMNEGFQIIKLEEAYPKLSDWTETASVLALYPEAWVAVDGYHFDPLYQQRIKETAHPLLVIDDVAHQAHYTADALLNQNIYASEMLYLHRTSCASLLLGPSYALLRREFWPWRGWRRQIAPQAQRILVTLGGSDPENVTLKVIQALPQLDLPIWEAKVVVGPANVHVAALREEVKRSNQPIELLTTGTDMPALMAWADIVVSAAGSTCWELAFMQLPMVLIILAENQQGIAEGLAEARVACNLGWFTSVSPVELAEILAKVCYDSTLRQTMSDRGQLIVDGQGAERVADWLWAA